MFQFYSQIITGSIRPHLIKYSNIEKVQSAFFTDKGGSILSDEALNIFTKKHGSLEITIDEELKKIVLNALPEEQLEELIDMRFPDAPDKKALTYQTLIELEYEKIKLTVNTAIDDSSKIDEIEFFAKRNIQKLKTLSKELGEYIKRLEGEHGNLFVSDSNHFILFVLKHHLIDTIQYIQESTSTYCKIEFESTDKLLAVLFNETPPRTALSVLSNLPKEKEFNTFRKDFFKRNKEHLEKNSINRKNLSVGKDLFDFYKKNNKNRLKEERISNFTQIINYWDQLLITGKLNLVEYDKRIKEPEIEQILLPLLKNEIELLQVITTPNMSIETDINNNNSEPQSEKGSLPFKDVMNINDLVEYTRISKSTIHKYTSAGSIQHFKRGKFLYFNKIEIDKWLQEKRGYNVDDIDREALRSLSIKKKEK